jgi:hypothetical protein
VARRKLSLQDQLRGVNAALKSKRTPPQLIEGLRRRAKELERLMRKRRGRASGTLGILGL